MVITNNIMHIDLITRTVRYRQLGGGGGVALCHLRGGGGPLSRQLGLLEPGQSLVQLLVQAAESLLGVLDHLVLSGGGLRRGGGGALGVADRLLDGGDGRGGGLQLLLALLDGVLGGVGGLQRLLVLGIIYVIDW